MKLSLCIVNYSSGTLLKACLDSLARHPPACPYEIIVVDNGSADGSALAVSGAPHCTLIKNASNAGFTQGSNQAMTASSGEYLLLLNADTEVYPGALDALVKCADDHPRAGLVAAKLLNPDGTPQVGFNVRRLPNMLSVFAQLMLIDEVWPGNPLTRRHRCMALDYSKEQSVEQPAAAALLYRRAARGQVGSLDARMANWYSDVDLCKRVREAGWDILYCPTAPILHHGGMGTISRSANETVVEVYRSLRFYFLKHGGRMQYSIASLLVLGGMLLRCLLLSLFPGLAGTIEIRTRQSQRHAMRLVFGAVLKDTWQTLGSLPVLFHASTQA